MEEYFFKVREMKNEPTNKLEFYVREKRYIAESLLSGVVETEVSEQMRNLSKILVEKDSKITIWISVERQT